MEILSNKELIEPIKDNQELINQIKQDHEQELKDIYYAIDVKTGKVKENDMFMFMSDYLNTSQTISKKGKELLNELNLHYIESIKEFKDSIKKYKSKKYKTIETLNKDIFNFNSQYDTNYYNGFNVRIKDLLDKDIQKDFIQKRASAIAHIQADNIIKIGIDKFSKLDLNDIYINQITGENNTDINFKIYIDISDLTKIQDYYKSNTSEQAQNEIMLQKSIQEQISNSIIIQINKELVEYKDIYKEVHKLYKQVNKDIISIVNNFKKASESLINYTNVVIEQPKTKNIPLLAPTIFNNRYINSKYTKIYENNELALQIKLDLDISIADFRENIIFYDNLTQKKIDLLPIDYAIFIACTELNANNKSLSGISGNMPISIDNIVQYVADNDKLYQTKKRQKKLYEYIKDRLSLYRCCIVDALYTKNGELKKLYQEPMPILYTNIYYNPQTQEEEYIIGASAILTIINQIEILENRQYLASYTRAREYINDGQNNTIEILNTKYYALPKLLQRTNAKNKGDVYNPKISLKELFTSIATLKGKDSLSRTEQQRVRESLLKFLEHLKTKKLLKEYDTKPLNNKSTSDKALTKTNQKIEYIYTKPNYKG